MDDFFGFLLALLTFDWLRARREAGDLSLRILASPQGECVGCEDDVYYDAVDRVWKHASTGTVSRSTPHGETHDAVKWLGWDRVRAAEKALREPVNNHQWRKQ